MIDAPAAVAMPVKTAVITFDALGYPGWTATVRTNPRSSVYDDLLSLEEGRWWPAFGKVVLDWNFADEDGTPFPQPADLASEKDLDLPYGVISYLFEQFVDEVKRSAIIPKEPSADSLTTTSTNGVSQEHA